MLNNSIKIAINQECGLKPYGTHIYLDGQEMHNVVGFTLEQSVGELPKITIDCKAEPDVEIEGLVGFRRTDLIEKAKKLQTYKMFEGDTDTYVSLNDVLKVLNGE